jgi:lipopolysaccharide export system permease protein
MKYETGNGTYSFLTSYFKLHTSYLHIKLLDRYVLRQFFTAALVSMAGFIIIYIAVDIMEKLDKFLDHHLPFHIILEYYINFTPQIIALILPVCLLLGSLFATGRMSMASEIVAMRSGGISLYRLMAPFVVSSALVCAGAVYFNGWILPRANVKVEEIIRDYVKEDIIASQQMDLYLQDSPTRIVSMSDYSWGQNRGMKISVQEFDTKDITHMTSRIDASILTWDSTRNKWHLTDAVRKTFGTDTSAEVIHQLTGEESYMRFSFLPGEMKDRLLKMDEMTNTELANRIQMKIRSGQDAAGDKVDSQSRYALAFSSLMVVLFGVPFASKKKRGGLSFEFSISIAIAFVYLAFSKVFQAFGNTGEAPPIVTAWLANFLFFAGSLVVIWKAQK